MASVDLKRPELILSQFPDSQTYVRTITRLQILQPMEVREAAFGAGGGEASLEGRGGGGGGREASVQKLQDSRDGGGVQAQARWPRPQALSSYKQDRVVEERAWD